MLSNYISKTVLAFRISTNVQTLINLLLNSKKYSHKFKNKTLNTENDIAKNYQFKISDYKFDVLMRTYKGDIDIFYEIFWKKIYKIPDKFIGKNLKTIIDLGAHVGFTSLFYATEYPNANIYAVEASEGNFNVLKQNAKSFKNITTLNKAVYSSDGKVLFSNDGLSYNTKISSDGNPIQAISVNTLMEMYAIDNIDLIKIDIEGTEEIILKENNQWLEKTDNIIIEIHSSYTISCLERDLKPFGFEIILPTPDNGLKNIFATKKNSQ